VTYNEQDYVAQSIESVLMQRTDFNYEIVIGEDCSTDSTRQIVRQYADRNPGKLRLALHSFNIGPGASFYQMLLRCHGEFMALLDGDDYWTVPDKLQKQLVFLDHHPECAMCFHNVIESRLDSIRGSWGFTPPDRKEISDLGELLPRNFVHPSSVMFRRNLYSYFPIEIVLVDWVSYSQRTAWEVDMWMK
jgi:glycosyltransferase involved in cell wall biosynthesis